MRELHEIYHYNEITKGTRLLAITGFGEEQVAAVAAWNALAANLKSSTRCLPIALGSVPIFRKVIDAVKLERPRPERARELLRKNKLLLETEAIGRSAFRHVPGPGSRSDGSPNSMNFIPW